MRTELLNNFYELSKHHSDISKIRDFLINLEIRLNYENLEDKNNGKTKPTKRIPN